MKIRVLLLLALCAATLCPGCRRAGTAATGTDDDRVTRGPLSVRVSCDGSLEARRMETVFSRFQGRATLVELVPEGTAVKAGDLLARLDASQLEHDLVRLRNELARAQAALDALANAEIPIERDDLAAQVRDLQSQRDTEAQILADTRELVERNLVPARETDQQGARLAAVAAKLAQIEQRQALTRDHLHPAKLARARADVEAARQQVELAASQLSNCVITAGADGLAVYLPVHAGSEYRALRVGDTLYPNQPFLCIPDMSALVVQSLIPESDLARVRPGQEAEITPLAYPDCRLEGTVEGLGVMAQSQPGYPLWQKFFRLTVRLDGRDERLRPGMSLRVRIAAAQRPDAILIPRRAVQWENGQPFCRVRTLGGAERRPLKLGLADDRSFEVLDGVSPGARVVFP